jgi:hypothetical protein
MIPLYNKSGHPDIEDPEGIGKIGVSLMENAWQYRIVRIDAIILHNRNQTVRGGVMSILLLIGIIVLVLWLLGFIFFRSLGWLLTIALIVGVILLIIWLLRNVLGLF